MIHGTVIGEVWSTVKVASLTGRTLLVVRPEPSGDESSDRGRPGRVVAVDLVGAGVGDRVLVAFGKAARNAIGDEASACEAAIVGVIDDLAIDEGEGQESRPETRPSRSSAGVEKSGGGRSRKRAERKARVDKGSAEPQGLFDAVEVSATEPAAESPAVPETSAPADEPETDGGRRILTEGEEPAPPDFGAVDDLWNDDENES